jgi:hypothetical protein
MKTLSWIRAAGALSVVALLAACGGGGDTALAPDAPPPQPVAWGSPAAFVPQGAAQKSLALNDCRLSVSDEGDALYKASLKIAANGDVSIAASSDPETSPTVIWSASYEQAQGTSWLAGGTAQTPTFILGMQEKKDEMLYALLISSDVNARYLIAQMYQLVPSFDEEGEFSEQTTTIFCAFSEPLTLQIQPSAARAAANLGVPAGVTGLFAGLEEIAAIEGGLITWQNGLSSEGNARMQFDLNSGSLAVAAAGQGPFTKLDFSLPAAQTVDGSPSVLGVYAESSCLAPQLLLDSKSKVVLLASIAGEQIDQPSNFFLAAGAAVNGKFLPLSASGLRLPLFGDEEALQSTRGYLCGIPLELLFSLGGLGNLGR